MPDQKQKRRGGFKELFRSQTIEREVPTVELPPSSFTLPASTDPMLPDLARSRTVQGDPIPTAGTRTVQLKTAPPFLLAIADMLTSFGAGPQAGANQIARRQQGYQDFFEREERSGLLGIQLAQREFDNRQEGRRLRLATRRQELDEKEFELRSKKLAEDLSAATKKLPFSLNDPHAIATGAVLAQLGVDLRDSDAVVQALARPDVLARVGVALSAMQPKKEKDSSGGSTAERLARLRVDPDKEPEKYRAEVYSVQRALRELGADDDKQTQTAIRLALSAEAGILQSERSSLTTDIRSLRGDLPFMRGKDRENADSQISKKEARVFEINGRLGEVQKSLQEMQQSNKKGMGRSLLRDGAGAKTEADKGSKAGAGKVGAGLLRPGPVRLSESEKEMARGLTIRRNTPTLQGRNTQFKSESEFIADFKKAQGRAPSPTELQRAQAAGYF